MDGYLTLRQVAELLDQPYWRVSYLFRAKYLPPPERVGGSCVIPLADVAVIAQELRKVRERGRGRRLAEGGRR